MKHWLTISFLFMLICIGTTAQEMDGKKLDSLFLARIPYNSGSALEDIRNGKVILLKLSTKRANFSILKKEDYVSVENKFEFKFHFDTIKAPSRLLRKQESEYNNVVYDYLDSTRVINSKILIINELKRLVDERVLQAQTSKNQRQEVRRKFEQASPKIIRIISRAEIAYRKRDFKKAFALYEYAFTTVKVTSYKGNLYNNMYHCKLNINDMETAKKMLSKHKEWITATKWRD